MGSIHSFLAARLKLPCNAMGIGTLNEGPLHAALKATYTANGGEAEVDMHGFVADAVRGGVVYEIQTGSFSGLARKLSKLADQTPVVLVHPIPRRNLIVRMDLETGEVLGRRKAPGTGALVHIVNELVYVPTLLNHPNLAVEVVLTEQEDIRVYDAKKRRGLGGWRTVERRLIEIVEGVRLNTVADLLDFVPGELPSPFTTRDLSDALDQPMHIGQKMAYCLRHGEVTEIFGKQGNALQYRLIE